MVAQDFCTLQRQYLMDRDQFGKSSRLRSLTFVLFIMCNLSKIKQRVSSIQSFTLLRVLEFSSLWQSGHQHDTDFLTWASWLIIILLKPKLLFWDLISIETKLLLNRESSDVTYLKRRNLMSYNSFICIAQQSNKCYFGLNEVYEKPNHNTNSCRHTVSGLYTVQF